MKFTQITSIALLPFAIGASTRASRLRGAASSSETTTKTHFTPKEGRDSSARGLFDDRIDSHLDESAPYKEAFHRGNNVRRDLWATDLARNRPVHVSSTYRNWKIYDKQRLVDGDSGSRWTSAYADHQWVTIDLGKAYAVDGVRLGWEDAYATSYELLVSTDGRSWTQVYSTESGEGGIENIPLAGDSGRYVCLYLRGRATKFGFSLWDFKVYGAGFEEPIPPIGPQPGPPVTDVARHRPVRVSSTYRDWKIYNYKHLVDGDSDSRWTSGYADNQWVEIDLGEVYNIDHVRLGWEEAHAETYEIKVSADYRSWTTVYEADDSSGGFEDVTFASQDARYVRLNLLTRATEYGFSLWDFEVYQTGTVPNAAALDIKVTREKTDPPNVSKCIDDFVETSTITCSGPTCMDITTLTRVHNGESADLFPLLGGATEICPGDDPIEVNVTETTDYCSGWPVTYNTTVFVEAIAPNGDSFQATGEYLIVI